MNEHYLSIGLMSGTSMDGIDVALLETDGLHLVKELGHTSFHYDSLCKILFKALEFSCRKFQGDLEAASSSYPDLLKEYLITELKQSDPTEILSEINDYLLGNISIKRVIEISTLLHAEAVKKLLGVTGVKAHQIEVVGYHGQVLFHQPAKHISVIVGDGPLLAKKLGIKVVNDFRTNDILHGGQGAPFAPLYHLALATRDHKIPVAVVNCGGIANISLIPSNNPADLIAFDTGPGNGLIDRLVRQRTAGKEDMDNNGHYGQKGTVDETVLACLLEKSLIKNQQNYFAMKAPKALDIGDLNLIPELDSLSLENACRTLEAFTAETIVRSLDLVDIEIPLTWILAGGGWNNPVILEELKNRLTARLGSSVQILTANQAGWNSQALEAQIFAYLAVRSLKNLALSMPGTTGVKEPISGGQLHLPQ